MTPTIEPDGPVSADYSHSLRGVDAAFHRKDAQLAAYRPSLGLGRSASSPLGSAGAENVRESEHRPGFDPWFELSPDMVCELGTDGYFKRLNGAWQRRLGSTREELMSRPFIDFVHPDDVATTATMAGALAEGPSELVNFENRYGTLDGEWVWIEWSAHSDGDTIYARGREITDRKTLEAERETLEAEREALLARVEAMARTDELTGLPNRRSWDEELRKEIDRARRDGSPLGVALLDLDHFKSFNDTRGHQAGDELLSRRSGLAPRVALY